MYSQSLNNILTLTSHLSISIIFLNQSKGENYHIAQKRAPRPINNNKWKQSQLNFSTTFKDQIVVYIGFPTQSKYSIPRYQHNQCQSIPSKFMCQSNNKYRAPPSHLESGCSLSTNNQLNMLYQIQVKHNTSTILLNIVNYIYTTQHNNHIYSNTCQYSRLNLLKSIFNFDQDKLFITMKIQSALILRSSNLVLFNQFLQLSRNKRSSWFSQSSLSCQKNNFSNIGGANIIVGLNQKCSRKQDLPTTFSQLFFVFRYNSNMSILIILLWLLNSKIEVVSAFELHQPGFVGLSIFNGTSRREFQFTAVQALEQIDTFKKWPVSFSHLQKSFFRQRLLYLKLQRYYFDSNFSYFADFGAELMQFQNLLFILNRSYTIIFSICYKMTNKNLHPQLVLQ
ncbi:Hypothetical_protein [Hexamita inflata]|uniref:Hypothetical_protein n=1 Tax=Hexamita inflata TaxID=28002 RepID=A0ABP1GG85_9EUKA